MARLNEVIERFIPAFAGTTRRRLEVLRAAAVHPRVRGDHAPSPSPSLDGPGSSPRSRGPREAAEVVLVRERFIPAFAGTTGLTIHRLGFVPVHPRVRGDHHPGHTSASAPGGSSPRSRGPPDPAGAEARNDRFIPAFAGTTFGGDHRRRNSPVHPRVRGDHGKVLDVSPTAVGSSPRSRGPRKSGQGRDR